MARKNLMDGLMNAPDGTGRDSAGDTPDKPAAREPRVDIARPRYGGGAIGAVSQSIAALKSRSVTDIPVGSIDAGGMQDRIDTDDPDHAALVESIRDHGQQVPILVRPHPEAEGRYQIVYGRRRLAALRDLGLPARALVRDLDDRQLVMAQGQENTARKDLTFIEKVNFARQMRAAEYDRKAICDALSVDKTVISRMLSIADRVPVEVIEMIGSAPGIGRDRWSDLATRFENDTTDPQTAAALIDILPEGASSDERFDAVRRARPVKQAAAKKPSRGQSETINSEEGLPIARVTRKADSLTLALPRDGNGGFEDWLADHLPEIHRDWIKSRGE